MLLKILQCPRQSPTTKDYPTPNINSVKVEKPQLTETFSKMAQNEGQHHLVRSCPTRCKVPKIPSAQPFNTGGGPILAETTGRPPGNAVQL